MSSSNSWKSRREITEDLEKINHKDNEDVENVPYNGGLSTATKTEKNSLLYMGVKMSSCL